MKSRMLLASLAVVLLASSGVLIADEAKEGEKKFAATCPVSDHPADETSVVKIEKDLKVYFCCDKCPVAFEKSPEKFDMQVRRQLLETKQMAQIGCPMCGKTISKDHHAEVGEAKIHFCCEKCLAEYEKADAEKKMAILFKDLPKTFTRQTMCPVGNKPINATNPKAVVEHEGKKVYFCCENCPKAFAADPAKFEAKLPQLADDDEGLPATKKEKS